MKKSKSVGQRQADLLLATEALARKWVDHWIECGDMFTADMKDAAGTRVLTFQDFLIRDIDLYARTGKYPKWAEQEEQLLASARTALTAFNGLERKNCLAYEFIALKLGCGNDQAANAGIHSAPKEAAKRVAKLMNSLDNNVNEYIGSGALVEEARTFRNRILAELRRDGWRITNSEARGWRVAPPREAA